MELHVFKNDYETIIASSKEHAREIWLEHGYYEDEIGDVFELSDFENLTIRNETLSGEWEPISMTCKQWTLFHGPGILVSTEV